VDHLSKLLVVALDHVPEEVPLLVHEWVTHMPQYMDMLRTITDRPVVKLTTSTVYNVEHLYLPSAPCMPPLIQEEAFVLEPGDVIIRREAVEFLRARLRTPNRGRRYRFYIDRQTAPIRLVNRDEVRQVFVDLGFRSVQPELLSFAEQQKLFASASCIAGQSGAGLVNVLLAPQAATLICLQAKPWKENSYANLAAYGGQRSLFIAGGDSDAPSSQHAQFTVDTVKLRATLTEVLS
jgi:capsular polysaccharide biosynthesis protein